MWVKVTTPEHPEGFGLGSVCWREQISFSLDKLEKFSDNRMVHFTLRLENQKKQGERRKEKNTS